LPGSIRSTLTRAMREATAYEKTIAQRANDDAIEKIRRAGTTQIHSLSPAQQAAWRRALQPVAGQMENRIGKDTVRAILREVGR